MKGTFIELLNINKGHFSLESGLHGDVWFVLENIFIRPALLLPFIENLSKKLIKYDLSAICGALVGGAFVGYSIAKKLEIDFFFTERFARTTSDGSIDVAAIQYMFLSQPTQHLLRHPRFQLSHRWGVRGSGPAASPPVLSAYG